MTQETQERNFYDPSPDEQLEVRKDTEERYLSHIFLQKSLNQHNKLKVYSQNAFRLAPAQEVHFFYTRFHLSVLQNCALIFSTNFHLIFTFKNALQNLVIESCSALKKFQKYYTVIY